MTTMTETVNPVDAAAQRFFNQNGYWLSPLLFSRDELANFSAAQDDVNAGRYPTGIPPMELGCDFGATKPGVMRKIDGAHVSHPVFKQLAGDERIGRIASALITAQSIRLWHDQLLFKPPGGGEKGNVAWHQDYNYWRCVDRPNMVTAWIPFHDVDVEIGTMLFVPESHRWGWKAAYSHGFATDLAGQREIIERELPPGAKFTTVPVTIKAGQVSFHHCLTLHCSGPNKTDRPRRSIVLHLQAGDCYWHQGTDGDGHMCAKEMVRLGRGEGETFEGPVWPTLWPK